MLELVEKLIDISPEYTMSQYKALLIIKVRMNDGEMIHLETLYDGRHAMGDVTILRHMK